MAEIRTEHGHAAVTGAEPGQSFPPGAFDDYPVVDEGITWDAETGKWAIVVDEGGGEPIHVGLFDTAGEAQWAQDAAVLHNVRLVDGSLDLATLRARYLARPPIDPDSPFYAVWLRSRGRDPGRTA